MLAVSRLCWLLALLIWCSHTLTRGREQKEGKDGDSLAEQILDEEDWEEMVRHSYVVWRDGQALTSPARAVREQDVHVDIAPRIDQDDDGRNIPIATLHPATRGRRHSIRKRAIRSRTDYMWPKAKIPYVLSDEFSYYQKIVIQTALQIIETNSCVRFENAYEEQLQHENHIVFRRFSPELKGCKSKIGRMYWNASGQELNLGYNCVWPATIVHETLHALGFYHTQSRPDRDHHIHIHWDYISPEHWSQFQKEEEEHLELIVPYDYTSLMHYPKTAFSLDGSSPTVTAVDRDMNFALGQRNSLSFYDIKMINHAYNCSASCSNVCVNEGYLSHTCQCRCPDHLSGYACEDVASVSCGGVKYVTDFEVLTSPNFPKHYGNNQKCVWLLKSPDGTKLRLSIPDFDLEDDPYAPEKCRDWLEIRHHGLGMMGPKYCGNDFKKHLKSISNTMVLIFNSDGHTTSSGFKAKVTVVGGSNTFCQDFEAGCEEWAKKAYCMKYRWMRRVCRHSCDVCREDSRDRAQAYFPGTYCSNLDRKCDDWMASGHCIKNSKFMRKNCRKACGYCGTGDCFDDNPNCQLWAKVGECTRNPMYMLLSCKKSCGVCDCKNGHKHCEYWAMKGECESNKEWMMINCPKACGISHRCQSNSTTIKQHVDSSE